MNDGQVLIEPYGLAALMPRSGFTEARSGQGHWGRGSSLNSDSRAELHPTLYAEVPPP